MALNTVDLPVGYYPDPTQGRPVFFGSIFVGLPDTDPEILGNQKQVTLRHEGGDTVVAQPVSTSAGGVPIYNGSPAQILVDGNYSLKVLNKALSQVYYIANAFNGVPVTTDEVVLAFDTVAGMVASSDLNIGETVGPSGYTTKGDGGDNLYEVVAAATGTADGGSFIDLPNTTPPLQARGLFPGGVRNVMQFGAIGTDTADDTTQFDNAGNGAHVRSGEFYVDGTTADLRTMTGAGNITSSGRRFSVRADEGQLAQRKDIEPFFGFDNGTTDTQIFTNSRFTPQGLTIINDSGSKRLFVLQKVTAGDTWLETERHRITEFAYTDDGSVVNNTAFSNELNLGHQSLSSLLLGSQLYFYAGFPTPVAHTGTDAGKGYSKVTWQAGSTDQTDVVEHQLFGFQGSGHRFEIFRQANVSVSPDGRYVLLLAAYDRVGNTSGDDSGRALFIYDRAEVEAAGDPLTIDPVSLSYITLPKGGDENNVQGFEADNKHIYSTHGFVNPRTRSVILVHDYQGNLVEQINADLTLSEYSLGDLNDHATLGSPTSFEPEGLALDGENILCLVTDIWKDTGDVVSFEGRNWASTADSNTGNFPSDGSKWVESTKTAAGAWDSATTYNTGTNYTRRSKLVFSIGLDVGSAGQVPLASGKARQASSASLVSGDNAIDQSYEGGTTYQLSAHYKQLNEYRNSLAVNSGRLKLFDERLDADNADFFSIGLNATGTREFVEVRVNGAIDNGSWINMYGANDSSTPNILRMGGGTDATSIVTLGPAEQLGFFGNTTATKQTSVPVTAAGIHAALVAYGLIT